MQIEVLGERYQLEDPIGRGGMATIYRGRDLRMDRTVAIKVLREVYSTDPKFVTRFQREAKAASALQHPNIVQVYDYGQTDGNYFIVMELIEGTDLRRYLRSRGVLDIDRAIIIAHDVALGLGAAHRRGIVHRDVKPQNVLVGRDGSIKLTDFGIASVYKDINAERLTTTGMTLGTVQYYAPEQAQGEIVSPAADVYALGIVMYEMLTGRTPFDGDTPVAVAMQHIQDMPQPPSQLNPDIPPALEDVILRCLEKVPEMRYRDGSSLARALEILGEAEMGGQLPSGVVPPGSTPSSYRTVQEATGARDPYMAARGSEAQRGTPSSPNNNIASAATVAGGAAYGARNVIEQPYVPQQPYAPQPMYGNGMPESASTRPFQRGAIAGPGAFPRDTRDSRFASIITALIILATILLLGFSVYLAAVLGVINLPFLPNSSVTPTVSTEIAVPNLVGMKYQDAKTAATNAGFVLQVNSGPTTGVVVKQSPPSTSFAARGSTILVDLQNKPPQVLVPNNLVGNTVTGAETILNRAGIPYVLVNAGTDPALPQNYVSRTSPASGQTLQTGQNVTLYVKNLTNGTPTAVPTRVPTPSPTAVPTRVPTPSPTAVPTPSPTAVPTPSPTTTAP